MSRIFIIDDDKEMGLLLQDFLQGLGHQVRVYMSAAVALKALKEEPQAVDLVITDLRMPGMDGIEFIRQSQSSVSWIPIILITAFGSISSAIEALKAGAFDYVVKPFKLSEIKINIDRAVEFGRLKKHNLVLRKEWKQESVFAGIVGKSEAMQTVFDLIKRVASSSANILIQGESGTGKELVARAIHNSGVRKEKPFVAINVTAIPESLLESELFGHEKGAFTGAIHKKRGLFEEAQGGTLFLDEIGDMDLHLQSKMLRALQEKKIKPVGSNQDIPVDVRIVAATHKDLKLACREGRFREDLYYRLSVIPIVLPPLRHRADDIIILARAFLDKFNAMNGTNIDGFTAEALQMLMHLPWEGNVRELENVIERAVVLCRGTQIDIQDLPKSDLKTPDMFYSQALEELPTLEQLEQRYIRYILDKTGGKKEKAAHILGVNRRTLYRKERDYGWVPQEESSDDSHESPNEG